MKAILIIIPCMLLGGIINSQTLFQYDGSGNMTSLKFYGINPCVQKPATTANLWLIISPVPATTKVSIEYMLTEDGIVYLDIINVYNQKVKSIYIGPSRKGITHAVNDVDISALVAGTYTCTLRTNKETLSKLIVKM